MPNPKGPSRLLWKLFVGYATLTVVALATSGLLIVRELEAFHADELTEHLHAQAITLKSLVRGQLKDGQTERLDRIAKEVGGHEANGLRVTIVSTDGTVLGDSQADISHMDSHHDREEIQAAVEKGWGESTRWSDTLGRRLKYVAVRVGSRDDPEGVVRVALAESTIGTRTHAIRRMIWTIVIVAMAATGVFSLVLTRLWTLPIRRITQIASRLSHGDLSARVVVRGSDELACLARSINEVGDHLDTHISTIDGQRRTLEALLDQLEEGVVVAGPDGKIILSNPATARLLQPVEDARSVARSWVGRPIEQCVPQHDLQRLLLGWEPRQVAEASVDEQSSIVSGHDGRSAREIRLDLRRNGGTITLLARGSDIEIPPRMVKDGSDGGSGKVLMGRILALTDITDIARTMQMKTDFVANASHELRTPLTAIRAAVETLMNADTGEDVASTKRFLRIIERHSGRLEALVADLLALSRVESTTRDPKSSVIDVQQFRSELSEKWADRIRDKGLQWDCTLSSNLREMTADVDLVRLVLDNLIENAIKFTDSGGRVTAAFKREGDTIIIEVIDEGCGIPTHEQGRVFERFYQVAGARSEAERTGVESRGTGLGLAIVQHAVASMNGSVSLNSEVGSGTQVTVTIPQIS